MTATEEIVGFPMLDGVVLACRKYAPVSIRGIMLLVPGFALCSRDYIQFCTALSRMSGIVVYALDLRGQGDSEGKPGDIAHIDQLREDLFGVVAELHSRHPDLPLWLAAHSSGSSLVLGFLDRFGDALPQGLIFISPVLPGHLEFDRHSSRLDRFRYWLRYGRRQPPKPTTTSGLDSFGYSPLKDLAARALPALGSLEVLRVTRPGVAEPFRFSARYLRGYSCAAPRHVLNGLSCPVWLLVGGNDEYIVPEAVVGLFRWHTAPIRLRAAERLENLGHFSIFKAAAPLIANWLAAEFAKPAPHVP